MLQSTLDRPMRHAASLGSRYWNRIVNWFNPEGPAAREWLSMTPEDRFRLAADIGLSEPEVTFSIRRGHDSRQLAAILARAVNRGVSCSLGVMRDMQRTCGLCVRRSDCRAWQAKAPLVDAYPPFCPNGSVIDALKNRRSAPGIPPGIPIAS